LPKIIGNKKDLLLLQQFLKIYIKKNIKCCHIINSRPYVLIFFTGTITPPGQIDHWWTMAGGSSISSPLAERSPGRRTAAACRNMDAAADAAYGEQRAGEVGGPRFGRAHALSMYGRTTNGVPASGRPEQRGRRASVNRAQGTRTSRRKKRTGGHRPTSAYWEREQLA